MSMALTSNISIMALILGYLVGSVPFGLLISKLLGLGDIRQQGSGNIGATNVLRTGNRWAAGATLLADMLKGTLPVLIASHYGAVFYGPTLSALELPILAGLGAFLGHLFPIWLRFKGGKGVATYIGVLIGLYWPFALIFCATWLLMALIFKISSLSALVAAAVMPLAATTTGRPGFVFVIMVMSALVFIKHKDNIRRLMAGTEGKIG